MLLSTVLTRAMRTWSSILMITMFAVDASPYRFSKRGNANASWDVSAEKGSQKYHSGVPGSSHLRDREEIALAEQIVRARTSPDERRGYMRFATTHSNRAVNRVTGFTLEKGLADAARYRENIELVVEWGLRSLLSQIGQVNQPGVPMPSTPEAEQPEQPRTSQPQYPPEPPTVGRAPGVPDHVSQRPSSPSAPAAPTAPETPRREEPVTPVEAPVPPKSDASIILIERSSRLSVEGLISELTVDVGRATRGFIFPMPQRPCGDESQVDQASVPFPDGELRIPDDAASFVIPAPGVQTVQLSHPILTNTNVPLVMVMEHVDSARQRGQSRMGAMQETCPLRVVQDSSTADLLQRSLSAPTVDAENIVAQIFGGRFDELSGSYKVLKHRFSQPHTLVMHVLVKLSEIDPLALLRSSKTMLKTSEGYKMILPLADELGAKVDSEQVAENTNGVELPVNRPRRMGNDLPIDLSGRLY